MVFQDANLESAANASIAGIFGATGQSCVAGSRLMVHKSVHNEFVDRLVNIALPRVRDFRGLNRNAFDGHGNYSLGLSEQLVFQELLQTTSLSEYFLNQVDRKRGALNIVEENA